MDKPVPRGTKKQEQKQLFSRFAPTSIHFISKP